MTKQEMVINILTECGCLTSNEISNRILRKFHEKVSPTAVSGTLRPYITKGYAAGSPNSAGKKVYWINRTLAWEEILKS